MSPRAINEAIDRISFIERYRGNPPRFPPPPPPPAAVKAALEATSVIDYAGKLIRQRLAVIRMQRTDPISLSPASA